MTQALSNFLEVVGQIFPDTSARETASDLREFIAVSNSSSLPVSSWAHALERLKVPASLRALERRPRRHCSTWCCTLHTMSHVLLLASVEVPASNASASWPSPLEVLRCIIEGFVAHLFYCKCCVGPVLAMWHDGAFELHRLYSGELEGLLHESEGALANVWLWQLHNAITKRLASQGKTVSKTDGAVLWPSPAQCQACYSNQEGEGATNQLPALLRIQSGRGLELPVNATMLYRHLVDNYWDYEWSNVQRSGSWVKACTAAAAGAAVSMVAVAARRKSRDAMAGTIM